MRRWRLLALLLFALAGLLPAHVMDDATLEIVVQGSEGRCSWLMKASLLAPYDDDGDRVLSAAELTAHREALQQLIERGLQLRSGERLPELELQPSPPDALATHMGLNFLARWPEPVESLELRYDLWPPGSSLPRCLLVVQQAGRSSSVVLTPDQPAYSLSAPWPQRVKSFVLLGLEHIFTGYDHLLFLLTLLLPGGSLGTQVKTVTAFTLAHSLTLSLSVLGFVTLPSRLVESVIALSIVVAALLNLRPRDNPRRWPLALTFGLVHGLGFASVLREKGVTGSDAVLPLISFNGGVELGQLMVVLLVFPFILWMHRQSWARRGERGLSILIALLALVWFVQRVMT